MTNASILSILAQCDSHTDFKVKRSKVKVTGRGHIVAAT